MILLDTNIISELRKPRPHGGVIAWFSAQDTQDLAIPSMVFYELQMGVERTRLQDRAKAAELDIWIETVAAAIPVLPLSNEEARLTARLLQKHSLDLFVDAAIAAIAILKGTTIATRNTRDFAHFPVRLVNPFQFR